MILKELLLVFVVAVAGTLSDDSVQLSESFGGPHGTEFSDQASVAAGQTIGSITIRAGERVDGVSLEVTGPTAATFSHGGTGGTENKLALGAGEYITSMEAHWGEKKGRTRIFYLSFGTSAGNTVSGGSQADSKNTVTAPEGFQLGGFFGQDGDEIDKLGAIWTRISAEAPATEPPAPAATEVPAAPAPAASASGAASDAASDASAKGMEAEQTARLTEDSAAASTESSEDSSAEDSAAASTAGSAPSSVAGSTVASAAASTEGSAAATTEGSAPTSAAAWTAASTAGSAPASAAGSAAAPPAGTEAPPVDTEAPAATAAPAMTVKDSIQLSESFGGPHGTDFSDKNLANSGQVVGSVSIHAGERLDGIILEVSLPKTRTFTHGGTGGDRKTLKLGENEYIISMEVHWGKHKGKTRIFYVNFLTNVGNSLSGGSMTEEKSTVTAPEGFQLGGFFGKDGKEIDALGAIWTYIKLVTPAPATATGDGPGTVAPADIPGSDDASESGVVIIPKNTQAVQLSESFGGPHGEQFSDQPAVTSGMTVASVTTRAGERIDGLRLEISAPREMTFVHGGTGGKESTLALSAGEYITSMEAHWGQKGGHTRIFYISFGTNKGNSVYGGTQTEERGSVTAPEGYQLSGFFGRFGDEIDLIGAVWTSISVMNETVSAPVSADEDIVLSAAHGGPHGVAFSDISSIVLGQTLSSITVRGNKRVDAVTLQVATPVEATWNHGGSGGTETSLILAPGEYINSLEVHWGQKDRHTRVFFVSVGTSAGNSVSAGTKTDQNAIETAPEGFQLSGFYGRADDEVDQLGVIWTRISATPGLLTDSMGTAWYGDIIRNWVGPTIGAPKDSACYRKTKPFDSKNICPLGYGKDDDDCITQCPMAYPVECFLECIPQNDNCALAVLQKIAAVAGVAFNAATAGVFGNIKTLYTGAKRIYMCAANVISVIKSLIYYFRYVQTTAPQGDVEQMLAVAYQSNVVLIDLPIAVYACLGMPAPKRLEYSGYVMMTVQFIVKQVITNGEEIISSAQNVIDLLTNASAVSNSASSVTELSDFIQANTSCGYELKKLTDRVVFAVNDARNKTPNAVVNDIRVTISRSLVLHDIPTVTNHCMKEMMANKTKQAAFETRDLLRKTMGVIIDQLIETSTTDMGESVAEDEYLLEVANFGLTALGGLDPTGIAWMASQFVQPICGPTSFIDDGNLYDALGLWTVDEAFVGSYGSWTKKGDGVVRLIFESTDTKDVTVVIYSGGDDYAKVDVGAGDTVTWESTVPELQDKTLYLDRWRPGLFGLPGSGGGSLLLWVPRAAEGGQLTMHVRVNVS